MMEIGGWCVWETLSVCFVLETIVCKCCVCVVFENTVCVRACPSFIITPQPPLLISSHITHHRPPPNHSPARRALRKATGLPAAALAPRQVQRPVHGRLVLLIQEEGLIPPPFRPRVVVQPGVGVVFLCGFLGEGGGEGGVLVWVDGWKRGRAAEREGGDARSK